MLVKDLEFIKVDFGNVRGKYTKPWYSEFLDEYFARRYYDPVPLANNAGEKYLNQLVEYMTCTLLPIDGSWLQLERADKEMNQEEHKKTEAMLQYLRDKLAKSNFYSAMQDVIMEGLIYNTGIATVSYTSGLVFEVVPSEDNWVADETDEYNSRSYAKNFISLTDLFSKYEASSIPDHIQKDYESFKKTGFDRTVCVISAVLPNKEPFVTKTGNYKFIQVDFLDEPTFYELKPKHGQYSGFTHFPLCRFKTGNKYSLASLALSDAVMVNKYEQMMYDRGENITYPPMGVPKDVYSEGNYDLNARGVTPLSATGQAPGPISVTTTINVTEATIAKREQSIREIFKTDLIARATIANMSQAEYAQNQYDTMKAIQPLASTLVYRTINALSGRMHKLLINQDSKYKQLASNANQLELKDISFDHLGKLMKRAHFLSKAGRFGQLAQFFVQLNPEAAAVVDAEKVLREGANTMEISKIVRDKSSVQAEQQAKAEALQQQQQAELQAKGGQYGGGAEQGSAGAGAPAGPPTGQR